MYKWEKGLREDKYGKERKNPSFSSTLLDEIYRSTDDGSAKSPDLKFYRETMNKKQSKSSARTNNKAITGNDQMSSLRRASLGEKLIDKKVSERENVKRRQSLNDYERKLHRDYDALFFSSTSCSSDSSSGGFSSSDTDSLFGSRSKPLKTSSFTLARPKPVKTSISTQPKKVNKTESALFYEQRELHMFDDYRHHINSETERTPKPKLVEADLIKSKSRALKIYSNLKKVKQPISPGGRLANFINSLFTTGNAKKTKNSSSYDDDMNTVRNSKTGQVSTCSSASSFSRSCLIKNSPSSREKPRNGTNRSVRFYPVSVIVDEDCRPCGHKCLNEKEDKRDGEIAREILRDYHQIPFKNDLIMRDVYEHNKEDDDDDDAASCSSSDLFELDNLDFIGNRVDRYCEELPVYETTHFDTNRAIANGLIM